MAKLKSLVPDVGPGKDLTAAGAEFDAPSRVLAEETLWPPEDVRPDETDAITLLLRITNPNNLAGDVSVPEDSRTDTFALIHAPATNDFAAVLVFNPSTRVESGHTFAALADEGQWPVVVAMVEEFLGLRVDHVAELKVAALGAIIDEFGSLPVYSRTAFTAGPIDFAQGTNTLNGASAAIFTSADPIDDAGQTRTRNQRAVIRALIHGFKSGGLIKDPAKGAAMLSHLASGISRSSALTIAELSKIANSLRQLKSDDVAVVVVPANSRRADDGTVTVDFDPEALPALKNALAGQDSPDFFRYLVSRGY